MGQELHTACHIELEVTCVRVGGYINCGCMCTSVSMMKCVCGQAPRGLRVGCD